MENEFFVRLEQSMINFGFRLLDPERKVHFTISFNPKSEFINLHLTKNISDTNKPTIRIIEISKEDIDKYELDLRMAFIFSFLTPVTDEFIEENKTNLFFNFDEYEKSKTYHKDLEVLDKSIREISKIKKKKWKLEEGIETQMDNVLNNTNVVDNILSDSSEFQNIVPDTLMSGYLMIDDKLVSLIYIENIWYQFNFKKSLTEHLSSIASPDLISNLSWYYRRSVIRIRAAKSQSDIDEFNTPIRIEFQK